MRRRLALVLLAASASTPAAAHAQQPLEPLGEQMRLTWQGRDGDAAMDAAAPAVAFGSSRNEYLLAWAGQDPVAPREQEVYARRLDGRGHPLGDVLRITTAGAPDDSTVSAGEPAIAYDALRDRYAIAYSVTSTPAVPATGPVGEVWLRLFSGSGVPLAPPAQISQAGAQGRALEPDLVANPLDGRFLVVWREDAAVQPPQAAQPVSRVRGRLVDVETGAPAGEPIEISATDDALAAASDPIPALRSTEPPYAVVWIDDLDRSGEREVFGRLVARDGSTLAGDAVRLTTAGPEGDPEVDAKALALATDPERRAVLLAFTATDAEDGDEVLVQRFADDLKGLGTARPVSSAGPTGSRTSYFATSASVSYSQRRDRFLVTWQGNDHGRARLSDAEVEISGRVLDGTAREVGEEFQISRMGLDGSGLAGPAPFTPASVTGAADGGWLAAWAADDARPPLSDEEYEIWGRAVGPNHDRDYDGSVAGADCDDLDARRHPGATDVADNGIDEDCSGGDNLDGDGDGSARPKDCDDRNPFIRPGRRDLPGNGIDEDCSGRDKLLPTAAKVRVTWFFGLRTTVGRVLVERARKGMRVTVRCRGRGCPTRLRRGTGRRVTRSRTLRLSHLFRGASLAPGTLVEIRVHDPRALGVVERYRIRRGLPPSHVTRCLAPERRRPMRCPR